MRTDAQAIRVDLRLGLVGPIQGSIGIGHGCLQLPSSHVQRSTQELKRPLHRFGASRQAGLEEWSPGGHRELIRTER